MDTKKMSPAPFAFIGIILGTMIPLAFSVAIFADGFWTFNINTLSDLGVSFEPLAANVFNYTCIIGGILMMVFGAGKLFIRSGKDAASGFFVAIAGVFLMAVGIFNESYSVHNLVAWSFFACATIALVVSLISDWEKGRKLTAAVSTTALFASVIAIPAFTLAGLEVICVLAFCLWIIGQGLSLAFSKA